MLDAYLIPGRREAGCDEAGRGPLAGPVVAAAVILPPDYRNSKLNDSKQLTEQQRNELRVEIEHEAMAWAIATVTAEEIDRLNILHASTHAMCLAVGKLSTKPDFLLIDGNRFYNETDIPYQCIVKGDAKYMSIAAASILAKTYRDELMTHLHQEYPQYGWDHNKGYPTAEHYRAIESHGISPYHRRSFTLYKQHTLFE
ncbi:MAG: ribonuclease HII [Bacteroidales bacterium]|nr:ribonuclease HII [Bacteroidales bacterium]